MSATTFLLILAAVVIVFVGFIIKSWSELSNVTRRDRKKDKPEPSDDQDSPH